MLDAKPDVASARTEDGAKNHGLGGSRLGETDGAGYGFVAGSGGRGLGVLVLVLDGFLVSVFVGEVVGDVISKRSAKAFLGGGGGGGSFCGGGEEARREESTEGVDFLSHCFVLSCGF